MAWGEGWGCINQPVSTTSLLEAIKPEGINFTTSMGFTRVRLSLCDFQQVYSLQIEISTELSIELIFVSWLLR